MLLHFETIPGRVGLGKHMVIMETPSWQDTSKEETSIDRNLNKDMHYSYYIPDKK